MTLPELAVRRPVTTTMILVSMFVIGAIALQRLPLAFMPEHQDNELFVVANYANASPPAIERMIVRPIEDALSSINGLKEMWSSCDADGGRVNVTFNWNVNIDLMRTEIRERLDRIRDSLPDDLERIQISGNWNPRETGETILEARISSGRDLSKNYPLLERKIIRPLERIPGVASVTLDGVNPREVKINLHLNKLKLHRVSAQDVWTAITRNNADRSLGEVHSDDFKYTLRAIGAFQTVDEIRGLPINDKGLTLTDVASVTYEEPPLEYGRHLEGDFAVGLSIAKESSANTVQVCGDVRSQVESMRDDPELEGISFLVWEDQGKEITNTINDLKQTGYLGAILAGIVLFLFLKRLSSTLVAVACIPFSLVVACGVIWFMGRTLNTISLLGLIVGIGMLVDNAVVVMENIDRYQKLGYRSRISAMLGSREVSIAVITATLTSVIVFLPLLFNEPTDEGKVILRELALTVCITLLASLFISQTLIPLATARFVNSKRVRDRGPIMTRVESWYASILGFTLKHRWLAPVVGLAVIGSIYLPAQYVDINLETSGTEMFVGIGYQFSENIPLDEKQEIVTRVEKTLRPFKDEFHVKSIYSWWSQRFSITRLYMEDGFTTERDMNRIRKRLPDILPRVAGLKLEVQDNVRPWQRNKGNRIGFQLRGSDSEVLADLAEEAKQKLRGVSGLFDAYSTAEGDDYELHAVVDRARAHAYGVDFAAPAQLVELTFRGRRLPRFKGPDGEVEMRLTLDDRDVHSNDALRSLSLIRNNGKSLPLESLAEFHIVKSPARIRRSNKATSVWVGAKYDEGKKDDHMAAAREVLTAVDLPYGYSWDFRSYQRDRQEAQSDFLLNLILALGLIFAVMAGLFESLRQALSLMVSLPFAFAGAWWTLFISGADLDQPASIGLMLLLGIVVNNGIVMVEHINHYRRRGLPREQAMLKGGRERLRPILMTAVTTLMSLIPIVIQKPALAGVYYYSMAYVIMGGLLVSTVLTSLLLPTTLCIVEDVLGAIVAWATGKAPRVGADRIRSQEANLMS